MNYQEILNFITQAGSESLGFFGGTFEGGWHIQQVPEELAETLDFLQSTGQQFEAYLEVGAAAGGTARVFQEVLGLKKVFVLDNNSHPKCTLRKTILPQAHEWIANSHSSKAFLMLLEANPSFDLIFIDAEHHYLAVWQDFWTIVSWLRPGGYFLSHDVFWDPGVHRFWVEVQKRELPLKPLRAVGTRFGIMISQWEGWPPNRFPEVPFHIITPLTRPENLPKIAASIEKTFHYVKPTWHIIADPACPEFGCIPSPLDLRISFAGQSKTWGHGQHNCALDSISEGWVYFLDDDNLPHPALEWTFLAALERWPEKKAFIFQQVDKEGGCRLHATPPVGVGRIDTGSAVIDRRFIGESRFPLEYCGDGIFFGTLWRQNPEDFAFLDIPACWYNALR